MFNYFSPKKNSLTQWAWYLLVMQTLPLVKCAILPIKIIVFVWKRNNIPLNKFPHVWKF